MWTGSQRVFKASGLKQGAIFQYSLRRRELEREDALGTGPGALKAFRFIQCPEPIYNEG